MYLSSGVSAPPSEAGHIGISVEYSRDPLGNGGNSTRRSAFEGSDYNPSSLNKINSNVEYKKFTSKSKTSLRHNEPNYFTHAYYLMDKFPGAQYISTSNNQVDKYLPFYNVAPKLSQATKDYLKTIVYRYVTEKHVSENQGGYTVRNNLPMYSSEAELTEELRLNYRDFVLAYTRSALRAGIRAEQILQELSQYLYADGILDDLFLDAVKGEQKVEISRVAHSKAIENDCCIDVGLFPDKYKNVGESFESFDNRFRSSSVWDDLMSFYDF